MATPRTHNAIRQQVLEQPSLERDPVSNAILNRSVHDYANARSRKALHRARLNEIADLRQALHKLESRIEAKFAEIDAQLNSK
jgi:hypothetical protein